MGDPPAAESGAELQMEDDSEPAESQAKSKDKKRKRSGDEQSGDAKDGVHTDEKEAKKAKKSKKAKQVEA